jgi:DNA polymerase III subunit chi
VTDFWFYHLERQDVVEVLPRILSGLYQRGERICVYGSDRAQLAQMSKMLWTWEETSFLPHGLSWEMADEADPICFATEQGNPNSADHLLCVGLIPQDVGSIRRVSLFFDGTSEDAVKSARAAWKAYQAAGHVLKYWRQNEQGRWEDQAAKASEAA